MTTAKGPYKPKDCGKKYGPRRLVCVLLAGHKGRHSRKRSAQDIGVRLHKMPPRPSDSEVIGHILGDTPNEAVEDIIQALVGTDRPAKKGSSS